jgi:23S rRNA (guanosine2251-2'-O)-methyltransferase
MSADIVGGINAVEGLLDHDPSQIVEVLLEDGGRNPRAHALAERARAQGIAVLARSRAVLDKLAPGLRHQGIVVRVRRGATRGGERSLSDVLAGLEQNALFLVLDGVQDPHNLGACLRSAEAAGVSAVIIPKDRAVGLTPVVHKASAGAADRVTLVRVTNLARALEELKQAGVWLTGLTGEATQSLYAVDLRGPSAVVLGGEGEGLRRLTRDHCDYLAKIPMRGAVESLNVSVATGIALFEALRQRGSSNSPPSDVSN